MTSPERAEDSAGRRTRDHGDGSAKAEDGGSRNGHQQQQQQEKQEHHDGQAVSRATIVTGIPEVDVTEQRKPFLQPDDKIRLPHTGTPRVNVAATYAHPEGTTHDGWAERHKHQTVLQQHCEFFDQDRDGVIWPVDTFNGLYTLGFGIFLSLLSTLIIHVNFSYATLPTWVPDPFFRIYLAKIHKAKHGSDSGTYDTEGRFVPQKFEDMFSKYADGRDFMNVADVRRLLHGQRLLADPIGWGGAFFEWTATYILLWPDNGRMAKEDIRGVYDGSIFYTVAARRKKAAA
ncbi:hypothetical protein HIM_02562 [Hirsutella minnesotensis 3608]|nr:hypothetical protein HIM_02562 [Hirsutella minnesotensis 3608]